MTVMMKKCSSKRKHGKRFIFMEQSKSFLAAILISFATYYYSQLHQGMESISAAEKAGLKWVEIDVGITLDNIVIAGHFHESLYEDCPTETIGQKAMVVSKTNYDILCSHSEELGLPTPPKLVDVLATFKGRLGFQIELKQGTDYRMARVCNNAASKKLRDKKCVLLHKVVEALEYTDFPANDIIISSFEAARLHNFRRLSSRYHGLKLVGGQALGVEGMIKICQMYLGHNSSVAIPPQFATEQRVRDLQTAGISVEIGLPGAGHCLSMKPQKQPVDSVVKKQIAAALALRPDSICTDFPRDALDQQRTT